MKKTYKILKVEKFKNEDAKKKTNTGKIILMAILLLVLASGCGKREISANSSAIYDSIDTTDDKIATSGIEQVLDVANEEFKLVVRYSCVLNDNAKWTITDDKQIYSEVTTKGLPEGYKVYIDNVHTDTTIRSIYPAIDGITQDTMDDKLHGEQLLGFPISDTNAYSNINCIEGQNDNFIKGSFYGFNGHFSGVITEKRHVESDYLKGGVYANKITSVIDLIIVKPDGTITCTSVPSIVQVSVWPIVEKRDNNGNSFYTYYEINPNSRTVSERQISATEYYDFVNRGKSSGK